MVAGALSWGFGYSLWELQAGNFWSLKLFLLKIKDYRKQGDRSFEDRQGARRWCAGRERGEGVKGVMCVSQTPTKNAIVKSCRRGLIQITK